MEDNNKNRSFIAIGVKGKIVFPVLIFLLLSLILLFVFGYMTLFQYRKSSDELFSIEKTEKLENILSEKIEKWKSEILLLSKEIRFQKIDFDNNRLDLLKKQEILPDYLFLLVSNIKGDYITSLGGKGNISDRKYFKEILITKKTIVSEPVISKSTQKPIFLVVSPIINEKNEMIGVIAGSIELSKLTDKINLEKYGESGYSILISNTGLVMTHMRKKYIMNLNLFTTSDRELKNFGKEIFSKEKGNFYYFFEGKRKMASFVIYKPLNWRLATVIDYSEIEKPVRVLIRNAIIATFIIFIIAALLIIITIDRVIIKPIKKLKSSVEIIQEGNLEHQVEIEHNDEIGELANAYNKMTLELRNDIIKLKESKLALKVSEERWQFAIEGSGDGVWDWERDKEKIYISNSVKKILGIKDDLNETEFSIWKSLIHPSDLDIVYRKFYEHFTNKTPYFAVEYRVKNMAGEYIWNITRGKVIRRSDEGKVLRVIGTIGDISERKKSEEELLTAKNDAEAANIEKRRFLANMSHEIRTPLNGIMGFLELLENTELTAEQRKYAEKMKYSSDLLFGIINDILDFSKIESGKVEIQEIKFDIYNLIKEIVELFYPKVKEKNIIMTKHIEDNVPEYVYGDPLKIRQILINIISNSVKFTQKGKVSVELFAENYEEHSVIKVVIIDTGIGIAEADMKKLFNPFTQIDHTETKRYKGTGLGLVICKTLVEKMQGEISVSSEFGKGTKFVVKLPLKISVD